MWLPEDDVGGVLLDNSPTYIWRHCLSEPRTVSVCLARLLQRATPFLYEHLEFSSGGLPYPLRYYRCSGNLTYMASTLFPEPLL